MAEKENGGATIVEVAGLGPHPTLPVNGAGAEKARTDTDQHGPEEGGEGVGNAGGTPALLEVQARIREIDAAREKVREEKVLGWWDEVALLTPLASVTEEIEGHQLTFVCPKFGKWLAALPHLQAVYNAGREGHEGESPLAMLFYFLRSWDAPTMLQNAGDHLAQILDLFQGQQAGWTAENFGPAGVVRMVRNYLRVIPVEELKRFFGESVGALKGQATAGSKGKVAEGGKAGG